MEPDAAPGGPEVEMGVPDMPGSTLPTNLWQTIAYIGGIVLTFFGTWGGIVLRRKRPKAGAEDAVYEVNRATILDLRTQNEALRKENDTLRTNVSGFDGANIRMQANLEVATNAARAAQAAAEASTAEMLVLRERWIKARQYIFTLRAVLAEKGLPIPEEPV